MFDLREIVPPNYDLCPGPVVYSASIDGLAPRRSHKHPRLHETLRGCASRSLSGGLCRENAFDCFVSNASAPGLVRQVRQHCSCGCLVSVQPVYSLKVRLVAACFFGHRSTRSVLSTRFNTSRQNGRCFRTCNGARAACLASPHASKEAERIRARRRGDPRAAWRSCTRRTATSQPLLHDPPASRP